MPTCCDIANYCVISLASSTAAVITALVAYWKVKGLQNDKQ